MGSGTGATGRFGAPRTAGWAPGVLVAAALMATADAAAPVAPGNPSPSPGTVLAPVDPELCVDVSDPDGGPLQVTFRGREVLPPGDDFTVVVIPDPQYYAQTYPDLYRAQMQWIADHRDERRIAFVTGLGDMTNNGDTAGQEFQWQNASEAFAILEAATGPGQPDGIPYGMCVGNHDNGGSARTGDDEGATTQRYNGTFGQARFCGGTCTDDAARACRTDFDCTSPGTCGNPGTACRSYVGGRFDFGDPARYPANRDDHYEVFRGSGMDFAAVHLEYDASDSAARQAVLSWMERVLAEDEPERRALIVQHSLIPPSGSPPAFTGMGQAVWDRVRDDEDVFLMLSGHLDQANRRQDAADDGHPVHSLVSDYQTRPYGGRGWLRILTFQPRQAQIRVQTLSPWVNYPELPAQEAFIGGHVDDLAPAQNDTVLPYAMDGGGSFADLGTVAVDGSGRACLGWPGRRPGGTYQWTARASDGTGTVRGPRWTFEVRCEADGDCDDGAACTSDRCDAGACRHEPVAGCCTRDDQCGDGNPCTDDACDTAAATCRFAANANACDDGAPCTESDACLLGTCAGTPVAGCCEADGACDDGSPCTDDACVPANRAALDFDGLDDRVDLGAGTALNDHGTAGFTVEGWFRADTAAAAYVGLFRQGRQGSFAQVAVQLAPSAPYDRIAVSVEATTSPYAATQVDSDPAPFTTGAWHHVAAVVDRTPAAQQLRVYLDGALVSTRSGSAWGTWPVTLADPALLGVARGSGGVAANFFDGRLDEWRVWNVARTAAEVRWGMHRAVASAPGLVARWALDEGQGAAAVDSVGGGLATVDGPAWQADGIADLGAGACGHDPLTGPACDDGDACSAGDACREGRCEGGSPPACDDGDACNGAESCDAALGCVPGTAPACDDRNACNGAESCDAALGCVSGTPPACDDGNACTGAESCDPATGCVAGTPPACDDGNACTDDACDPLAGCVAAANEAPCLDGDPCTVTACRGGSCAVVGAVPGCCTSDAGCDAPDRLCDEPSARCVAVTCLPCVRDGDCGAPGNACASLFSGTWCLVGCPEGTCPEGTACTTLAGGRRACVPDAGDCRCVDGARADCRGGDVVAFDSCGQPGDVVETCDGRGCLAGACCPEGTREDGGACRPDLPEGASDVAVDVNGDPAPADVPPEDPGADAADVPAAPDVPADLPPDAAPPDPGPVDDGPRDLPAPDDGPADVPPADDPAVPDAPAADATPPDLSVPDLSVPDTTPPDPSPGDLAATDPGPADLPAADGPPPDVPAPDLPPIDTVVADVPAPDSGPDGPPTDLPAVDVPSDPGRDGTLPEAAPDVPSPADPGPSGDGRPGGRSGGGCTARGAPSPSLAMLLMVLGLALGAFARVATARTPGRRPPGTGNR